MSSSDRMLLILHVGFAIFTLGPLTTATSVTPRYIRRGDVTILRYLHRTTRVYGLGALGIFLFGMFLADGDFARVWLSASMTLFLVALVLLMLVERDQRRAIHLLEVAAAERTEATAQGAEQPGNTEIAQVERGRIAALSGVVALIWVVILILMVWNG
ncbi:hypothetical protein [Thermomonospora umbrina]|uniref:Uncharacterized protein n=1 Tax=Thermomonospora umbrina TaxID=111806 RepID=A0A3D9SU56_9ACTN|nr:hypothetical protein [Thermomonospora umbrina]REE96104.1 hypothetical protein DFJ69_1528 [Thermomonospora umbrina]